MERSPRITQSLVKQLAKEFNVNIKNYPIKYLQQGMKVELEHWKTVNGNISTIMSIVLDHLKEFPSYYDSLEIMEQELKKTWSDKTHPELFKRT